MKNPRVSHWQFRISFKEDFNCLEQYEFTVGLFKILRYSYEGRAIGKEDYKGFILRKSFKIPTFGFTIN